MKRIEIIILFTSLFLFTTPLIQATELPTETNSKRYIENLVDSYNSLIKANHIKDNPHFEEFKKYFYIYHDDGYSFKVVAVRGNIYDNSTLFFIFSSIISPDLVFEFDYLNDVTEYDPLLLYFGVPLPCKRCTFYGDFFISPEKIRYADFTITALSEDILNSTMTDSTSYARELYNENNGTFQSKINQKYPSINQSYPPINQSINITENTSKENIWNWWIFTVILTIIQTIIALLLFEIYKNFKRWRWHPVVTSIVIFMFQTVYSGIFYQFYLVDTLDIFHNFLWEKISLGIIPFIPLVVILIFIIYDHGRKEEEKKLKKLQKQQEKKEQQSKKNK